MAFGFRPGFSHELAIPSQDVIEQLAARLTATSLQLRRTRVPGGGAEAAQRDRDHLVVTIPPAQRHFWSPWLTLEVDPTEHGTHLDATFSPHPSVWTGFMFGYLALAIILVFSLVYASAVLMAGGSLWSLWVAGGALGGMAAMWWASQVGQRLARTQMDQIRGEVERAIDALAR